MRIAKLGTDQTVSDAAGHVLFRAFRAKAGHVEPVVYDGMPPEQAAALQEATWKQTMYRAVRERECYACFVESTAGNKNASGSGSHRAEEIGALVVYQPAVHASASSLWSDDGLPTPHDADVARLMPDSVVEAWKELGEHVTALKKRCYPKADHYTVSLLGTHPSARGKGLGGALVRHVLNKARADGMEVCLSTDTEQNVRFYSALGFRVLGTSDFTVRGMPIRWYCMSTSMFE